MQDVAARRQALNDDAYKSVLQTLFARSKTDAKFMLLMSKLRKELNISAEQHKQWLQQLQAAKQSGTLNAILSQSGSAQGHHHGMAQQAAEQPAAAAGAGAGAQKLHRPAKRRRALVMNDDDDSDNTASAGESHGFGHAGMAHQQQQQQQWRQDQPAMYGQQPHMQAGYGQHQQQGYGYGNDYALKQQNGAGHGVGMQQQRMAQQQQQQQLQQQHAMQYGAQPQAGASGGGGGGGADKKKKQAAQDAPAEIPEIIGHKVHRYWPKEGQWFEGIITDWRSRDNNYCITYHLGKKNESMEWFDIHKAEAVGNPQLSHYQLTPEKLDLRKFAHTRAYQNSSVLNGNRSKKGGGSKGGTTSKSGTAGRKRTLSET